MLRRRALGILGAVLIAALASACGGAGTSSAAGGTATPAEMVSHGSWYVVEAWPHDGHPYQTAHFVVYSDAASAQARREAGDEAERLWAAVLDRYDIEPAMLHFPSGHDRIDLYAYHDYYPQAWGGRTYYGGLLMWSPDHPYRPNDVHDWAPVMEHELVHELQFLIMGREALPFDTWFTEGLAEATVGGTSGGAIRGRDQLDALTATYGQVSPISIKGAGQIPGPDSGYRFYYPMFELANEYLFAPNGLDRSTADARDILIDVAGGATFATAFQAHMGISLATYQDEFFSRMDTYLPAYRSIVFTPIGIGVLSALVTLLALGALAAGFRWRVATVAVGGDAASGAVPEPPGPRATGPGRALRIGFYGALALATVLLIVVGIRSLTALGTDAVLYNASNRGDQALGYGLAGGYLVLGLAALVASLLVSARHPRLAFLGPALVAGAGIGTALLVSSLL